MPPTPGLPPAPKDNADTKKRPSATPISAGAFSFSLGGTPKRPRHDDKAKTPLRPAPRPDRTPAAIPRPAETPKKAVHSLNAIASPFRLPPVTPGQASSSHRRITALVEESPFRSSTSKYGDNGSPKVPMGQLAPTKVEDVPRERVKREDEGIGVSPRKHKGLKWTGHGPTPPSLQLANLLSSTNSSILLFYNSLQRTLYPPSRTNRPETPSAGASGSATLPVSIQAHVKSAPLVLRPTTVTHTRTHQGIMLECEVVAEKSVEPGSRDTTGDDPFAASTTSNTSTTGKPVRLVLQQLPHDCPRLGVDPKIMLGKMHVGAEKSWTIAVWSPFSITEVSERSQSGLTAVSGDDDRPRSASEGVETAQPEEKKVMPDRERATSISPATTKRVVFASRYLIIEAS